MNRRKFIKNTTYSGTGLFISNQLIPVSEQKPKGDESYDIMKEVKKYRKIDAHAHVYFTDESPGIQIDFADRLHIDKLMISRAMAPHSKGTPEEFKKCNDLVLKSMNQYPDRFIGMPVVNPVYAKESLEEIDRCLDLGMVGIGELYNHIKINDPLYYPIIEKYIDLKMIIHMHSAIGYSRVKLNSREPKNISLPEDFVDIAMRYPEAMFQFAHLGGGIDWEYACKTIQNCPNIYVDVSGSNNESKIIEFALEYLGEDRIFFGCDNSFYQGVGHMLSAKLTDKQRRKIFFDNYNNILKKSGNHVD
ncbi:amidohydrolase family protein [Membranihabitans maritimus]|uniref:amidohydrolase family protein n=1 Tax=Membranihabitans maritimus TaxID=2904244 RepID=UPI001F2C525B|nr:amidohydrolase family protein [Membranihabitans maritimus]